MSVKYIAVPCDDELYRAVVEAGKRSGLKLGPECAQKLRTVYRVGVFAPVKKGGEK